MLQGIDVSSYQSTNYGTGGLGFVFIKVTEGTSYVNPNWQGQRSTATGAGLVKGFYHYPHIANDPIAEADHFLSQISLEQGDVLCLDWEWYGQSVSNQQALDYRAKWIPHVQSKAPGHKVVLYADLNNWKNVDSTGYCGDGLWIADYTTAGQPRTSFRWTFHQYSDSPQDQDVANPAVFPNGLSDLRAWAGLAPQAPAFPGEYLKLQTPMLHDNNVRTWQQKMHDRGWPLTVDGWYGQQSATFCRQFQAQKGLQQDGVVGPSTWAATWDAPVTN